VRSEERTQRGDPRAFKGLPSGSHAAHHPLPGTGTGTELLTHRPPFSTGALSTPVPSVVTSPQSNCAIFFGTSCSPQQIPQLLTLINDTIEKARRNEALNSFQVVLQPDNDSMAHLARNRSTVRARNAPENIATTCNEQQSSADRVEHLLELEEGQPVKIRSYTRCAGSLVKV
jgi:hypothetical protein